MAAISCREPLLQSIQSFLRQLIAAQLNVGQNELPKPFEEAISQIAESNVDQAVSYIVKNASEKAGADIDVALEHDYAIRAQFRSEGRPFKPDPSLIALNSKLPDALKMSMGSIDDAVYDEFSKSTISPDGISDELADPMRRTAFATERTLSTNSFDLPGRLQNAQAMRADGGFQLSDASATQPYMQIPLDVNRTVDDFQSKVESILREWINMCHALQMHHDLHPAFRQIIEMMRKSGLLISDEIISKFFKVCTDICFDVAYRLLKNDPNETSPHVRRQRCHFTLDAFVKLSCLMVKHSDNQNNTIKLNLLKQILSILTQALISDHDLRREDFNGLPFLRIFISMFTELTAVDPELDQIATDILKLFTDTLYDIQPRRLPRFVFHWLEIVGHRNFLGRFFRGHTELMVSNYQYVQLLIYQLRFLGKKLIGSSNKDVFRSILALCSNSTQHSNNLQRHSPNHYGDLA
jgi:hypothetical protein